MVQDESEPISINYTSGTTGKSKGAVYTHRGAYLQAHCVAMEVKLGYDSVRLWTLPMFHCNGWCLTWGVTRAGGVHVCLRKVEPDRIWDLFESEGVTHYSGAPTVHMGIVNHDKAHRLDQHVTVPTGGSPPTPALLKRMRELNLHPIHLYGLTETYGPWAAAGSRSGMSATSTSRRGCSRGRVTPTTAPTWCGWSTTTCRMCSGTARRWARS